MEAGLRDAGLNFSHVVRTWFYLDDILDWYGPFNAVRNQFFTERNVFQGVVPASTGVGMRNPAGAALTGAVLAVKPLAPEVKVFAVPSPLQCPALDYQSSFSRAVEVQTSKQRHLYISGTASIDPAGHSLHRGDVDKQIELTMAVVEAILQSRKMDWSDTSGAVGYFKDLRDVARFEAYCRSHGLSSLPVKPVEATICRTELLFEIELEASTARRV
jgi:enamine deaminase RidA (YjgF/YER057c/UK114 family)